MRGQPAGRGVCVCVCVCVGVCVCDCDAARTSTDDRLLKFRLRLKVIYNPFFGSIFRTQFTSSFFSRRLFRVADIYTSRITNMNRFSHGRKRRREHNKCLTLVPFSLLPDLCTGTPWTTPSTRVGARSRMTSAPGSSDGKKKSLLIAATSPSHTNSQHLPLLKKKLDMFYCECMHDKIFF